ncbi:60S ribosomal protein L9 [Pyrus ussuriensis x Pyrus communis]|uniref:60S ribosomal protein L9 n=1 Tax=Pyrus ussuriensis x Pyrus communis TaxID=2448454 RepID=A0A5N5I6J9_9ROSA|nr:60S ribosomal protein L9 [Pyrus ussuriensis x Pyrus communis]
MMTILSSETMDIPDDVKIKVHAKIIKVKDNPILDVNDFFTILCPDQPGMPSCISRSFLMGVCFCVLSKCSLISSWDWLVIPFVGEFLWKKIYQGADAGCGFC